MNGLVLPDVALAPMMPILLTLLGATAATVLGFFLPRRAVAVISLVSLVLSAASMFTLWDRGLTSFGGSLQADNAAIALGIVLLIGSALAVLVSLDTAGRSRLNFPEFDAVLMFAVTGTLVIAFSGDLITMLIGLEVMSLSGYVLATLQDSHESEESGLKYFLLGATGSAILIYGIALVYGATGSFNFAGIAAASSGLQVQNSPLLVAGALLLLCRTVPYGPATRWAIPAFAAIAALDPMSQGYARFWLSDTPAAAAFLASTLRAPFTALVLLIEFTNQGATLLVPAMLAIAGSVAVNYLLGRRRLTGTA